MTDEPTKEVEETNEVKEETEKEAEDKENESKEEEPKEEKVENEETVEKVEEIDLNADKTASTPTTTRKELEIEINERKMQHEKLRSYEVCRRSSYKTKLNSSNLYWKSFRELMDVSVKETQRAVLLVKGRILADVTFGQHMNAIYENVLEGDGRAILDEKRRKRIILNEKKGEYDLNTRDGLLSQVVDCHEIIADRYEESAKVMKEEILPELENLSNQLSTEVVVIEALGDTILSDLQSAENELQSHWDAYYTLASLSLSPKSSRKAVLTNNFDTEMKPVEDLHDVWVAEMQYRMSVAFLSAFWEKCSAELSRIFATMKDAECSRRFRLKELMIRFMQGQEKLWSGLPGVISPALKEMVDGSMDRPSIENDVQTSIRMRAQAIQRSTKEDESPPHPGLANANPSDGNFELSSPLLSTLLSKSYVVEKKTTGMMSSWKTNLAVVTKDSYLHLFDIPPNLKVTCGSAPEVAFYALVPPVIAPTEESVKSSQTSSSKIKKWNLNLIPADSLALPNCRISFKDDGKNSAFEIVETVLNTGASKMFGKISLKKLYLRTLTREDTVDWIQALSS